MGFGWFELQLGSSRSVTPARQMLPFFACALSMLLLLAGCSGNSLSPGVAADDPPPVITSQPQDQTLNAGTSATFTVSATGTEPFTYQWSRTGTAIDGAEPASYTTPATTAADNGAFFTVLISNQKGA